MMTAAAASVNVILRCTKPQQGQMCQGRPRGGESETEGPGGSHLTQREPQPQSRLCNNEGAIYIEQKVDFENDRPRRETNGESVYHCYLTTTITARLNELDYINM